MFVDQLQIITNLLLVSQSVHWLTFLLKFEKYRNKRDWLIIQIPLQCCMHLHCPSELSDFLLMTNSHFDTRVQGIFTIAQNKCPNEEKNICCHNKKLHKKCFLIQFLLSNNKMVQQI